MKELLFPIAIAILLVACGGQDEPDTSTEPEIAEEAPPERESRREVRRSDDAMEEQSQSEPSKDVPRLEGAADSDGYGLTMIIDGSSPEAFKESLSLIAEDTTQKQYRQLDSAIRYLKTYSSSGWGDTADFYQSLDGMTGEEVIEKASQHRK